MSRRVFGRNNHRFLFKSDLLHWQSITTRGHNCLHLLVGWSWASRWSVVLVNTNMKPDINILRPLVTEWYGVTLHRPTLPLSCITLSTMTSNWHFFCLSKAHISASVHLLWGTSDTAQSAKNWDLPRQWKIAWGNCFWKLLFRLAVVQCSTLCFISFGEDSTFKSCQLCFFFF